MVNPETLYCDSCGNMGLENGNDGFFYCTHCNTQAADIIDTCLDDEDFNGIYSVRHSRRLIQPSVDDDDDTKPPRAQSPPPFSDDPLVVIRLKYVMGLQRIIQLQCESLVRNFKVNPLICGLAGTIWLRFVAVTQVFNDGDSEPQQPTTKNEPDPEAIKVFFVALKKMIPLPYTLAVSYLACHVAREAVLPTDIVKWSLQGMLPYFSAFLEIEDDLMRQFGRNNSFSVSSVMMFRPSESVPVKKLELLAAKIAGSVGLHLPPVNFHALATRFLEELGLPVEKILPNACRVYEWAMPPEMWLSSNELRLPSRVCVMSILIVAVRIMYNIHGFGEWEKSLSGGSGADKDSVGELLCKLEARYHEIGDDNYEYCKDLPTYLQFCKDVVFAGSESSHKDGREEKLMESLWYFYQSEKNCDAASEQGLHSGGTDDPKRLTDIEECNSCGLPNENKCRSPSSHEETSRVDDHQRCQNGDHCGESSQDIQHSDHALEETFKDEAINRMKLDMEENRFCYIPPRVRVKRSDYLHYERKQDDGALTYVAHADYYILLRACARVAQVATQCMHFGVLSFERRLAWLEKRVDQCLHITLPKESCQYCTDKGSESTTKSETIAEESVGIS